MSQLASIPNSLASLFGGGGNVFNTGASPAPSVDPFTAALFGAGGGVNPYDPSGSVDATAAITGNYGAGANFGQPGSPDVGGTQSDQSGSQTGGSQTQPSNQPAPQPAMLSPTGVASSLQQAVAQGGGVNPWVPGGTPPASPFADRFGSEWASSQRDPEGKQSPQGTQWQPPVPPGTMAGANAAPPDASGGYSGAAQEQVPLPRPRPAAADEDTDSTPSETSEPKAPDTGTPRGAPAATTPPPASQPGAGRGGMFNPLSILGDIAGVMSGNPMALGKLVQDLMGMGGQGMGGGVATQGPYAGQPISQIPWMTPQQLQQYQQTGQFPQAGQAPGQGPGVSTGSQGQPAGAGGLPPTSALPPVTPDTSQLGPEGVAGTTPGTIPHRTAQDTGIVGPDGRLVPGTGGTYDPDAPLGTSRNPYRLYASAPAAAGPAASTPLTRNEVSVPDWAQARIGGNPPLRPTQQSVDRGRFQNEADPQTIAKAAWMVNGEIGLNRPVRDQIVQLETAFNRAQYRNTTLNHALMPSLRRGDPGYYDGRTPTPTYRVSARPSPQQIAAFKQNVWDPVMKGSNLSDVGWGPMTGNASGPTARDQLASGTRGYKLGQETYFREGPFRHQLPPIGRPTAIARNTVMQDLPVGSEHWSEVPEEFRHLPQNIQVSPDAPQSVKDRARYINEGNASASAVLRRLLEREGPTFDQRFGRWATEYHGGKIGSAPEPDEQAPGQ